jgi:hypothetical protein
MRQTVRLPRERGVPILTIEVQLGAGADPPPAFLHRTAASTIGGNHFRVAELITFGTPHARRHACEQTVATIDRFASGFIFDRNTSNEVPVPPRKARIGCLRWSTTLVYLYRRELEFAPILAPDLLSSASLRNQKLTVRNRRNRLGGRCGGIGRRARLKIRLLAFSRGFSRSH